MVGFDSHGGVELLFNSDAEVDSARSASEMIRIENVLRDRSLSRGIFCNVVKPGRWVNNTATEALT